jgi:hypothetical protein
MRGRVWQKFSLNVMKEKIKPALEKKKLANKKLKDLNIDGDNFRLKDSVGSESVTSDIDLSAEGENTELGVAIINQEFRAIYNQEPGAFFDINVYSSDCMFLGNQIFQINNKMLHIFPTIIAIYKIVTLLIFFLLKVLLSKEHNDKAFFLGKQQNAFSNYIYLQNKNKKVGSSQKQIKKLFLEPKFRQSSKRIFLT